MPNTNAQYSDLLRAVNQYGSVYNHGNPSFVNPYSGAAYSPFNYREIRSRKPAPVDPRSAYTDYDPTASRIATGSLGYQMGSQGLVPAAKGIYSGLAQKSYAGNLGGLTLGSTLYGATRDMNPYEYGTVEQIGTIASPALAGASLGGMISSGAAAGPIGAAVGLIAGLFMNKAQQKKTDQANIDAEEKFQEERTEYTEDIAKITEEQREQLALGAEADLWAQEAGKYANQYGAYTNPYGQSIFDKGGKLTKKEKSKLKKLGRHGDSELAHVNPQEKEMLKAMGGSGTINPYTELPEYHLTWNMGHNLGHVVDVVTSPIELFSDVIGGEEDPLGQFVDNLTLGYTDLGDTTPKTAVYDSETGGYEIQTSQPGTTIGFDPTKDKYGSAGLGITTPTGTGNILAQSVEGDPWATSQKTYLGAAPRSPKQRIMPEDRVKVINPFKADFGGIEGDKQASAMGLEDYRWDLANPYIRENVDIFDEGGVVNQLESLPVDSMQNRQLFAESSFNPSAESHAGALGLSQITEPTFNDMIGWGWVPEGKEFNDLKTDTELAVNLQERYMNDLMTREWNKGSDQVVKAKALAAYNMGPTALVNVLNKEKEKGTDIYNTLDWVNNLPNYKKGYKETKNYVNKILLGGDEKFEKDYTAAWKAGGKDYNKGGKYQNGGRTPSEEAVYFATEEFKELSEEYRQRYMGESGESGNFNHDDANNMRNRLWELSKIIKAKEQSRPVSSNLKDIHAGAGTYELVEDVYQESQTPLFGFTPPKEKPIPPMPIKEAQPIPIKTSEPVLEKAGPAPEYKAPTVDIDISKEFHHRKYKEEDGKYSMFNPVIGKWKPITKKSYKDGIKNSTYNQQTGAYDQWWHKGKTKKDSITDGSVLEYLKQNTYDKGGKVSEVTNDPTFKVWYASNAKRPDVMATSNTQELLQLFLADISMNQMPLFSGEIDKHGNVDKSKRPLDLSLKILENPDYNTGGKINTVAEFTGNEMIVNNQSMVETGIKENNPSKAAAPIRLAMQKGFLTPGQETHQDNPMPVDDKGFIYTKGGKLPFRVRKGAGIYDHATDQFKQDMTDEQIMAVAKKNISKWEKNNMN